MNENENILDDQFADLRKLKVDENNTEFLSVHQGWWKEELVKYERKFNIGCGISVLLMPFVVGAIANVIADYSLLVFLIPLFYKIVNAKRGNNLVYHGYYNFELSKDKMVRYASSDYDIFHFKDILEVKEKSFGLLLRKRKTLFDYLSWNVYRHERKTQLVIPNKIYAYDQVRQYILEKINNYN